MHTKLVAGLAFGVVCVSGTDAQCDPPISEPRLGVPVEFEGEVPQEFLLVRPHVRPADRSTPSRNGGSYGPECIRLRKDNRTGAEALTEMLIHGSGPGFTRSDWAPLPWTVEVQIDEEEYEAPRFDIFLITPTDDFMQRVREIADLVGYEVSREWKTIPAYRLKLGERGVLLKEVEVDEDWRRRRPFGPGSSSFGPHYASLIYHGGTMQDLATALEDMFGLPFEDATGLGERRFNWALPGMRRSIESSRTTIESGTGLVLEPIDKHVWVTVFTPKDAHTDGPEHDGEQ